jgi:hypothetical protein
MGKSLWLSRTEREYNPFQAAGWMRILSRSVPGAVNILSGSVSLSTKSFVDEVNFADQLRSELNPLGE